MSVGSIMKSHALIGIRLDGCADALTWVVFQVLRFLGPHCIL